MSPPIGGISRDLEKTNTEPEMVLKLSGTITTLVCLQNFWDHNFTSEHIALIKSKYKLSKRMTYLSRTMNIQPVYFNKFPFITEAM